MAEKKKSKRATKRKTSEKIKTKKEEVSEIFEVEKGGKEKLVKVHGQEEVKIATKNQIAHQKKLLRNILIVLGALTLGFVLILMSFYSVSHFESDGVKYEIVKTPDVTFYHTSFQSKFIKPGITVRYKLWIRNDPRELKKVPFEGSLNLLEMAVLESKKDFNCNGDGAIAVNNFNQIMKAMGTDVIKDPEASCDSSGRYNYFELKSGEETKIVQTGPTCYDFIIKDCEILEATERFLTKALSSLN